MSSSSSSDGGSGGAGDFEAPSSSRSRMRSSSINRIWPEPFVEALAFQVALDASLAGGRLAAAPAISNIFQVCSTWRAISQSDILWQNLSRRIWSAATLDRPTWQEEYVFRHRTYSNFRRCNYTYATLHFVPTDNNNNDDDGLSCRRLALSRRHLAAGFSDGAVHLFHIPTRMHLSTFYPQHRDRLGRFSSAVSGIVLTDLRLVFATLDGDIHMAVINGVTPLRRAHLGDVVKDGALVDFSGSDRWWVGLYAGVPGHAFHIWNSETEELVFIGGTLTNPESVMGWHLLTELTDVIGRVRVTRHDTAVACTGLRVVLFDLRNHGMIVSDRELHNGGAVVGAFDANDDVAMVVDARGTATVRRVGDLTEVCRFRCHGSRGGVAGGLLGGVCLGYGVISVGGGIRVWDVENGRYLYRLREGDGGGGSGEFNALICDDRLVVVCSTEGIIHLWDF
ncbi:hypothetical protein M569_01667, partial [Genlisea aurea]